MTSRNGKNAILTHVDRPPYSVVCSFCKQGFSVGVPIIGETNDKKIAQFGARLACHMMTSHPDEAQKITYTIQNLLSNFAGLLSFSGFDIHDTEMLSQMNEARRAVKHVVMGPVPTDEKLHEKVEACLSSLTGRNLDKAAVYDLLKELRDVMQEKVTEPAGTMQA